MRTASLALVGIAFIAVAEPADGAEARPAVTAVEQVRPGLIIGGGITFHLGWSLASILGANLGQDAEPNNDHQSWPLFVPLAGPFIAMGLYDEGNPGLARALYFANGLTQLGGFAMICAGITARETVFVATGNGIAVRGSF